MRVLGIETSCDETGFAIYCSKQGLLGQALYSQIELHKKYGGVVPELASRDHIKHLLPLLNEVLLQAKLQKEDIDAIAYTAGPGLIGALLTGSCFAKSLAFALNIPSIAVHHLEAHLLVAQLESDELVFPFVVLLVSGGHTQLVLAKSLGNYVILGESLDDAVGEAFDKTAKLMGIPYPGGPELARLADSSEFENFVRFSRFPRPMIDKPNFDFSFSGLKTHALNCWYKSDKTLAAKIGIAKAFQDAVIDTLIIKCKKVFESLELNRLVIAGGVGANKSLRRRILATMGELDVDVYFPKMAYCTDNGVMVAYAGCLHLLAGDKDDTLAIDVKARWPLSITTKS